MPDNTVIFDVQAALTRLMENKNLYRKLLQRFESEYNDYDEQIKRAVASGDVEEATRMAHTLKGLAGNLGADSLAEASRLLEKALREGTMPPDLNPTLDQLSVELGRAIEALRSGLDI